MKQSTCWVANGQKSCTGPVLQPNYRVNPLRMLTTQTAHRAEQPGHLVQHLITGEASSDFCFPFFSLISIFLALRLITVIIYIFGVRCLTRKWLPPLRRGQPHPLFTTGNWRRWRLLRLVFILWPIFMERTGLHGKSRSFSAPEPHF